MSDNIRIREVERLRRHLDSQENAVLFFIELSPGPRSARCRLPSCTHSIRPDTYRVALSPGMSGDSPSLQHPDLYHVVCFEELVDYSDSNFLDRFSPLTRMTFNLRNTRTARILDGDYLCQGGVERLVLEWKSRCGLLMDQRDGVTQPPINPDLDNLLRKAGSSAASSKIVPGMTRHEYFLLAYTLAPFESDGPSDVQEWNLFEAYLGKQGEASILEDKHSLSKILEHWEQDSHAVMTPEDRLSEDQRLRKAQLGPKAVRAIKRLSEIPMPDVQSAFRNTAGSTSS